MGVYCGRCEHGEECGEHPERFLDCQDNAARFVLRQVCPDCGSREVAEVWFIEDENTRREPDEDERYQCLSCSAYFGDTGDNPAACEGCTNEDCISWFDCPLGLVIIA